MSESDKEAQNYDQDESEECSSSDESAASSLENSENASAKNLVQKSSSEILQERIDGLKSSMTILRNELKEERELWKKEVEEIIKLTNNKQNTMNESGDAGASESEIENGQLQHSVFEEYEKKLDNYKQSLSKNKANLQKRIAMSNYQRKLLEVENMCNLELLRVKQNIQCLQPLQMMTSDWNLAPIENCNQITDVCDDKIEPKATNSQIEMFTSKLYNEVNDMFSKISPISVIHASLPHLTTTSLQQKGNDYIALSQSAIWYSADCIPTPKF